MFFYGFLFYVSIALNFISKIKEEITNNYKGAFHLERKRQDERHKRCAYTWCSDFFRSETFWVSTSNKRDFVKSIKTNNPSS